MSGKEIMDDFNEREIEVTKENTSVTWEDKDQEGEAVCAVCDALFAPSGDRPPILCRPCKTALHSIIQNTSL